MGYLGRRIGLSQDKGDSTPGGADGAVGGGILDLFTHEYFERQGKIYGAPGAAPGGLTATGGVISDYTDGSKVYRAHVFTTSGTFNVSADGTLGSGVEYLVVAGGGGGGGGVYGGGGGAGGLRTNLAGHPLSTGNPNISVNAATGSYTVTVGGGGNRGDGPTQDGANGSNSVFHTITSNGGGGGRGRSQNGPGIPGGSGGGQSYGDSEGAVQGYGYNPSTPSPVVPSIPSSHPYGITQGNDGGLASDTAWYGTGGGGAGQQGSGENNGPWPNYGYPGGDGIQVHIAGPPTNTGVGQTEGWFAGGGGGGGPHSPQAPVGGRGGGGAGGSPVTDTGRAEDGQSGTGGGGGGAQPQTPEGIGSNQGGAGGSGIVVIRYVIAELTATAKATGGAISFYGGKTIHTFTTTGTFTAPASFDETVEYVVVAGGGGGGKGANNRGGGGGAGGYLTGTTPITGPSPIAITVGGGGASAPNGGYQGGQSVAAFPSPITSTGGGLGGNEAGNGGNGGSGGGAGGVTSGGTEGSAGTGSPPQGNAGSIGYAVSGTEATGGGGGGAGGAGRPISDGTTRAHGGLGVQLPSTFRNPVSQPGSDGGGLGAPGPGSTYFWVAGGGGAATGTAPDIGLGGSGTSDSGPFAGGGDGGSPTASSGITNTGGGGGGGANSGGSGGSGIVLIAYPT